MYNQVEEVALALKKLIGYGCKPHIVLTNKVLMGVFGSLYPDDSPIALSRRIVDEIKATLDEWEKYEPLKADCVRESLALLSAHTPPAPLRRINVINKLGAGYSVYAWRKSPGPWPTPELDLMREFAHFFVGWLKLDGVTV